MSSGNRKKKKKSPAQKRPQPQPNYEYSAEDVFAMMNDTSQLIAEQNSARLSIMEHMRMSTKRPEGSDDKRRYILM